MKKFNSILICFLISVSSFAQMAINTNGASGNASAMLDISSPNKGLLIPRVALQSTGDNTTIPNPATGLLVYNTNAGLLNGTGIFFNKGTAASPFWQSLTHLELPYYEAASPNGHAFKIDNYSQSAASSAIKGYGGGAGRGIEGHSNTGVGVYAHTDNGTAMEVVGKFKIDDKSGFMRQGKVLTSDANGNATWQGAIAFRAEGVPINSAGIVPLANAKVKFETEAYDLGEWFSGPNAATHSTFTVPQTGIYHFDVQVAWVYNPNIDAAGSFLSLKSKYNGVTDTLAHSAFNMADLEFGDHNISIDVKLELGTQVWVEIMQSASVQRNLRREPYNTYFSGHMVVRL